jgi:hypothetical protein
MSNVSAQTEPFILTWNHKLGHEKVPNKKLEAKTAAQPFVCEVRTSNIKMMSK